MCLVDFLPCLYLAVVLVSHLWVMQNFPTSFTLAAPPPNFPGNRTSEPAGSLGQTGHLENEIWLFARVFAIHSIWKLDWSGGTVCINGEIWPVLTLNGKLPQRAEEKLMGLGNGYGRWGQTRWKNNISTGRYIFPHHFLCLFFLFVSNPPHLPNLFLLL